MNSKGKRVACAVLLTASCFVSTLPRTPLPSTPLQEIVLFYDRARHLGVRHLPVLRRLAQARCARPQGTGGTVVACPCIILFEDMNKKYKGSDLLTKDGSWFVCLLGVDFVACFLF